MAFEVTMPQMGADMTEGTLVRWFKQVGEHVDRGEVLAEIETDKANVELEAFEGGTVLKHLVAEGDVVPVGEVIALLGEPAEPVGDVEPRPPLETAAGRRGEPTRTEPAVEIPTETIPQVAPGAVAAAPRMRISPVAKRIANQAGVDVALLKGSGPDGRILRRDVEAAAAAPKSVPSAPRATAPGERTAAPLQTATPAPRPERAPTPAQGLPKIRQAIARRMTLSKQTQPHYYLTVDVDMTAAMKFREQLNGSASEVQRVSINDLVVKACAIALERHPKFNAEFGENGLIMHDRINIDIGIALEEGLIAPAILDCGHKSLGHIATETKDLVERAKTGRLRADEYSDGTFTITNLGAYGVEALIGIINPPQAAILGVGSVMERPVVRDGQVVVGKVMKVALSADHRVSDGAEGARFIKEIQGLLENPVSLAL